MHNHRSKSPKSTGMRKATPKKKKVRSVKKFVKKVVKKKTIVTKIVKTVTKTTFLAAPSRKFKLTKENKIKLRKKRFYAWKDDAYVIEVLKKRGWTYCGEPVNGRTNYPKTMWTARSKGKLDTGDCLYWADDDDGRVLRGYSKSNLVSTLPNSDKSLTKVHQQKMFGKYKWFPICFTLPAQKNELLAFIKKHPKSHWIAKPRDSYGGFGMCVFKAGSTEFRKLLTRKTTFVVQQYMDNPYLLADKYKFHFRCYMVITNACKPFRAYLYKNAQLQFCTHKFDLSQIEKSFNKYSHITNYKVNNEKKNRKAVLENKTGIGSGSEWSLKTFFEYQKVHDKQFSQRKFWKDLKTIAKVVAREMPKSAHVSKGFDELPSSNQNHFEIYGLDVIIDENRNLALTEANTQPGLDWTDPTMSNGVFNPEIVRANDITKGVINDTLNLLGLDKGVKPFSKWIKLH